MTTLYFVTVVVTYLANAIYFATKLVAFSAARNAHSKPAASESLTRCCN